MPQRTCSLDGCDRKHYGWGLCNLHWNRQRKFGSTDDPNPSPALHCEAPGCEKHNDKGRLCSMHSARRRKHGSFDLPAKVAEPIALCEIGGCDREVRTAPWCNAHYQRYLRNGDPLGVRFVEKGCKEPDCDSEHYGLGWCVRHWARFNRHGSPDGGGAFRASPGQPALRRPPECLVETCENEATTVRAKFCKQHRSVNSRPPAARPFVAPTRPTCKVEDCENIVNGLGYCVKHYQRFRRHGDPSVVLRKPTRFAEQTVCIEDDCERVAEARDRCSRHYNAWLTGGDFKPAERTKAPCAVERCDRDAFSRGWCETHYTRHRLFGDVLAHRKIGFKEHVRTRCATPGCERWQVAFGDCIEHYGSRRGWSVWNLLDEGDDEQATADYIAIVRGDPCVYCGRQQQHVDHIHPRSRGGADHWSNYAPACARCNLSKHAWELLPYMLRRLNETQIMAREVHGDRIPA